MNRLGLVLSVALATAGFANAADLGSYANAPSEITLADAASLLAKERAASTGPANTPLPPALRAALSSSLARDASPVRDPAKGTNASRPRVWSEQKLTASDGAETSSFGSAVVISGKTALIGAASSSNNASFDGAVYVFTEADGIWSEQQKLVASDSTTRLAFGSSIALHGSTVIIGAWGGLYGGARPEEEALGRSVDQADVGPGAAYVFSESNGVWSQTAKLVADVGHAGEYFGQSVAISETTAMVGAFRATVDPAKPEQGAVYVFTKSGETWTQTQKLVANDGQADDSFGWRIALAGNQALIGAFKATLNRNAMGQGVVYAFNEAGGQWTQAQKLSAHDGQRGDYFGTSVALSGSIALIGTMSGGMHAGSANGAAYIFNYSNGYWAEQQKLTAQNGDPLDAFGISVALSGSTALVGAYYARVGANPQQGAAFVFTESDGRWIQTRKLAASDGAWQDRIGFSVALDGATAIVGAQTITVNGNNVQGAAYIYASHETAAAALTPTALRFHLAPGEVSWATLSLANHGGEPLDYAIDEATGSGSRIDLNLRPAVRSDEPATGPQSPIVPLEASGMAGPLAPAMWSGQSAALSFALDDGNYEDSWTLSHG